MINLDMIPALEVLTFWSLQTIVTSSGAKYYKEREYSNLQPELGRGHLGISAGLPGGGLTRQGPRAPRLPPPLAGRCRGCRNCGQPGLPNATTAASLSQEGREAGGEDPGEDPSQTELGQRPAPCPLLVILVMWLHGYLL